MSENKYLAWIRKYKDLLSLGNLETFIGVPSTTLYRYLLGERAFPAKHIRKLEKKMTLVVQLDNPFIHIYIQELTGEYYARQRQITTAPDLLKRDLVNAQRQQLIDDIIRAYLITIKTNPTLELTVFEQIRGIDPNLMQAVREVAQKAALDEQEPLKMPQIWKLLKGQEVIS